MEKIAACSNDVRMTAAWASAFSINESNSKKNINIVRKIGLLYDELQLVRKAMETTHFSKDLWDRAIVNTETVMQIEGITNQISSYRPHLTPEYFVALKFCAELLPHEEDIIESKDLEQLQEELQLLLVKVKEGSLPLFVKEFIVRQIGYIEQAINDYPILGANAFKEAMKASFVECVENEEIIKVHKDSEEIGALTKIYQTTSKYGGPAMKIAGYIGKVVTLIEAGIKLSN